MRTYKASDLVHYSYEEMTTLPSKFNLHYDDNEIVASEKNAVIFSWLFWLIGRKYPFAITKNHNIRTIIGKKQIRSDSHLQLMSNIYVSIMLKYNLRTPLDRVELTKDIVNVFNDAYNSLLTITQSYMCSVDITDFTNVTNHPAMAKIYNELRPTQMSIDKAYKDIRELLMTEESLKDNFVAKSMRANFISSNQILQCVGPRGFGSDVDSSIFPNPILRSYTHGLRSLHDSLVESRSASKAYYFAKSPLEQAEYASRRFSLLAMTVENVHYEDCGSTNYLDWYVKPAIIDEDGSVVYGGDLPLLQGKYYLNDAGALEIITSDHKHLIGKAVKLRSVIAGCNHSDPNGVCSVCVGEISQNISPYANLGHHCAANMMQIISQAVLSTKHYDGSSKTDDIQLGELERKFFTTDETKKSYILLPSLSKYDCSIIIPIAEASSLNEISIKDDLYDLSLTRISSITQVGISVDGNITALTVKQDNRRAVLTHEFLIYVKEVGYQVDSNNYIISLDEWDFNLPIMTLPDIAYSMSDHANNIADIVESKLSEILERTEEGRKFKVLSELFELVNSKIKVNLSYLEVILYAVMVNDVKSNDFNLPKNGKGVLSVASLNISRRSLGAALAYEGIYDTLLSPHSHYYENQPKKPDSPMDVFLQYEK